MTNKNNQFKYICNLCNYNSNNINNYQKHLNTNKHNINEKNNKFCFECNKSFSTRQKYTRHMYHHINYVVKKNNNNNKHIMHDNVEDKINNTNKYISNKIDHLTKTNEESNKIISNKIDDLNKSNQEVVKVVNKALTRASTLIKYLMQYHPTTPPLQKINYKECIDKLKLDYNCIQNNYALQEILVREYRTHIFVKKISNSILNLINHKNPEKQPIWNTDCSRNHYVVKTPSAWNEDKAGIKFTEYIIKPILTHIRQLIHDYRVNKLEKTCFDNFTELDMDEYYLRLSSTLELEKELLNGTLVPQFLKELSPHLRYIQKELEEIEQFKELEELQENLKQIIKNRTNNSDFDTESESDNDNNNNYNHNEIYEDSEEEDNIYIPQKIYKTRVIY